MKRVVSLLVAVCLAGASLAGEPVVPKAKGTKLVPAGGAVEGQAELLDKWIVRSVKRDGKPTPAQIGREVGDVIEIKKEGHQFELS